MVAPTLSALLAFYKVARVTKFALPLRTMEGRVAVGPSSSFSPGGRTPSTNTPVGVVACATGAHPFTIHDAGEV